MDDLASDDFDHLRVNPSRTRGPVALGNEIQRVRTVFKFAYDASLIDRPVRHGPTFKRPSKKTIRRAQQENGDRMFEAAQIRTLFEAASVQM